MGVRFVLGRSGTGKTRYCLQSVVQHLHDGGLNGPRLVLLVPEQSALQMERALVTRVPAGVIHRAEVLSFHRLAQKVLDVTTSPTAHRALSEPARAMVLRHLVSTHSHKLGYYRRAARLPGFIERLNQTMAEFVQEAVSPADLAAAAGTAAETRLDAQAAKLRDLSLLLGLYLQYLDGGRLDPSQYLQAARECLDQVPWLHGACFWVDGFASFSHQEALTLVALAQRASRMEITLLLDPAALSVSPLRAESHPTSQPPTSTARVADLLTTELFARTKETHDSLTRLLSMHAIGLEDPLFFGPETPRFQSAPTLACLERQLFDGHVREAAPTDADRPRVEIVECPSRRVEVEYAVSRICEWVHTAGVDRRYRDVAIIVRDLEPYHDLVTAALQARDIPYFIDRRRPTSHHPLPEFLRSAIALAAEEYSLSAVRALLKTGLLPLDTATCDVLENYLIAHGIEGMESWQQESWRHRPRSAFAEDNEALSACEQHEHETVNAARHAFMHSLQSWVSFARAEPQRTGREWAHALVQLLEFVDAGGTLGRWAAEAIGDGEVGYADECRQVWTDTLGLLDDLAFAFSGVEAMLSLDELAAVLESGLAGFTLGLAPPMVDQVLVGSIERSRQPDLQAVVVMGFREGEFPRRAVEDSVLNDDDRAALRRGGVRVRAAARDRRTDEALLCYIALTRASEQLVLTWPSADGDGRPLQRSPFVEAVTAAVPGAAVIKVADPWYSRQTWNIQTHRDAAHALAWEFRARPAAGHDDPAVRAQWNELYLGIRSEEGIVSPHVTRSLAGLLPPRSAQLSRENLDGLLRGKLRFSISQLESYAACPFQWFVRYGLRLRERDDAALENLDIGRLHHAILEDFVTALVDQNASLHTLNDTELVEMLRSSCDRVTSMLRPQESVFAARDAYTLRRSASIVARLAAAQRRIQAAGHARPRCAELAFGMRDANGLPALVITTPGGRTIELRGFIDRVDLAEIGDELLGVVVDYKTGAAPKVDVSRVYHGLSLQLPAYLLVLAQHGHALTGRAIRPVGAVYVSLAPQYRRVAHPSDGDRSAGTGGLPKPRGLLRAWNFHMLDSASRGWSPYYAMRLRDDGQPVGLEQGDGYRDDDFHQLLEHTRRRLAELADKLLDGDVAVRPYRLGMLSPCSWCAYPAVCRYEVGLTEIRYLDTMSKSNMLVQLGVEAAGPGSTTAGSELIRQE